MLNVLYFLLTERGALQRMSYMYVASEGQLLVFVLIVFIIETHLCKDIFQTSRLDHRKILKE